MKYGILCTLSDYCWLFAIHNKGWYNVIRSVCRMASITSNRQFSCFPALFRTCWDGLSDSSIQTKRRLFLCAISDLILLICLIYRKEQAGKIRTLQVVPGSIESPKYLVECRQTNFSTLHILLMSIASLLHQYAQAKNN